MSLRCSAAIILLLGSAVAPALAGDEIERIVGRHSVWIQAGLAWERDPGDRTQEYASATVLYFAKNGDFGKFSGTLIKHDARLALSEGEGEIVYAGTWKPKNGAIQVDYRLVGMYKLVRRTGEEPPVIPGPVKHAEIRSDSQSPTYIEFDGTKFEATSAISTSELKSRLQRYAPTDSAKHSGPK